MRQKQQIVNTLLSKETAEDFVTHPAEKLQNLPGGSEGAQLERMKELCKERNNLYEKQNDLKRTEIQNRKIVGTIRNVGRGGCYALNFIMANREWK